MTKDDFYIKHIYNEEQDTDITSGGVFVLVPQETVIHVEFGLSAAAITSIDDLRFRLKSGDAQYLFALDNLDNNMLTLTMPVLKSTSNNITFACLCRNTEEENTTPTDQEDNEGNEEIGSVQPRPIVITDDDGEDETKYSEIEGTIINYEGYRYPVVVSLKVASFVRYTADYSSQSYEGKNIVINKLTCEMSNGSQTEDLENSSQSTLVINKEGVERRITLQANLFNGYSDTNTYLLDNLNKENYFQDTNIEYEFTLEYWYKTIEENSDKNGFKTISKRLKVGPFKPIQSYMTLQLIGKTTLDSDAVIYGGVAMGQQPTIKQLGYAAFECGYPAIFSGYRYGYYPGDQYVVAHANSSDGIPGFMSGSNKNTYFTLRLGQPIFAKSASISGNGIIRGTGGYLTGYKWTAGGPLDGWTVKILDYKSGSLVIYKVHSSSRGGTNNTPIFLNASQNSDVVITFA